MNNEHDDIQISKWNAICNFAYTNSKLYIKFSSEKKSIAFSIWIPRIWRTTYFFYETEYAFSIFQFLRQINIKICMVMEWENEKLTEKQQQ